MRRRVGERIGAAAKSPEVAARCVASALASPAALPSIVADAPAQCESIEPRLRCAAGAANLLRRPSRPYLEGNHFPLQGVSWNNKKRRPRRSD